MADTWVVVERIPNCNMCDPVQTPAYVDGATVMGPWANMCEPCFDMYGVGLGLGKGQRLLTEEPMMAYDPKRDPIALHPLYPLMQGVLHVLNSTAYYDSGRWVMDRDEALILVETAFKHKMERLDDDLIEED